MLSEIVSFSKLGFQIIMRESHINPRNMDRQEIFVISINGNGSRKSIYPDSKTVLNLQFDYVYKESVDKKGKKLIPITDEDVKAIKNHLDMFKESKTKLIICSSDDGVMAYEIGKAINGRFGFDKTKFDNRNPVQEHNQLKFFQEALKLI